MPRNESITSDFIFTMIHEDIEKVLQFVLYDQCQGQDLEYILTTEFNNYSNNSKLIK